MHNDKSDGLYRCVTFSLTVDKRKITWNMNSPTTKLQHDSSLPDYDRLFSCIIKVLWELQSSNNTSDNRRLATGSVKDRRNINGKYSTGTA